MIELYRESATPQHLVATDIIDRMWYLAWAVISYSHLFTVWKRVVSEKSRSEINDLDKWLTYHVIIDYTFIDQGKCYSQLNHKDSHLSDDMKAHVLGYTGCSLDDFNKHGERRLLKFKFCNHFSEKAMTFFKCYKYQKDLLQHIRNYMNLIHEE